MLLRLKSPRNAIETDALLEGNNRSVQADDKYDEQLLNLEAEFTKKPLRFKAYSITVLTYGVLIAIFLVSFIPFHGQQLWKHDVYRPHDADRKSQLFDEQERVIIQDFDSLPVTSNFLSGIAGVYGKPMFAYYVNRGQAISSFGSTSKDYPIMEFNSANKAYKITALEGFRTFIQGERAGHTFIFEPFSPLRTKHNHGADIEENKALPQRNMYIGKSEVQIQEIDFNHKFETNISYFILPEEKFGAFVRRTSLTNIDPVPVTFSFLDGLAQIEPYGGKLNYLLKNMGRTLEAWFGVYQVYNDTLAFPFYRFTSKPADTANVIVEKQGHYCFSFVDGFNYSLNPIVYDTSKIFGEDTSLLQPLVLFEKSISEIVSGPQYGRAKTASAFAAVENVTLTYGQSIIIYTIYGLASDIFQVPVISRRLTVPGFMEYKRSRAREIHEQVVIRSETITANKLFDAHIKQMFLDNSLRGGIPLILGERNDEHRYLDADESEELKVYHVFSRVHGDLERDYNDFLIDSTFYSQGPGNFRDVAQNRRNDVLFNPRVGSFNVKLFLSLIQADGYNPLSVEGVAYTIEDEDLCDYIALGSVGNAEGHRAQRETLARILKNSTFRPGQLLQDLENLNIELIIESDEFINIVLASATALPIAAFKDGYWADHFTYILDLIDTYISVFPDREEALLYDSSLPYFFSPTSVRPREEKYHLLITDDGTSQRIIQFNTTAVNKEKDFERMKYYDNETKSFGNDAFWQHDSSGRIFRGSAISKLLVLSTIKFATLDPYGMGIEYEAGKPGWNDALNGLVGKLGSGMAETFELERILRYILRLCTSFPLRDVVIPNEVYELIDQIERSLSDLDATNNTFIVGELDVPKDLFRYWDIVSQARELYRAKVSVNFSGAISSLPSKHLSNIIHRWLEHISIGKTRALKIGAQSDGHTDHIVPTYFYFDVTDFEPTGLLDQDGNKFIKPLAMRVNKLPLFLEGPTRMLKTVSTPEALLIYKAVRNSSLRDEKLGMYTISSSLMSQSYELGRIVSFPPGWLENQSVWTHMSYKFYLELLRNGLYEDFFSEMTGGGMLPFMQEDVYGRSLTECSSFIASSSFEDPSQIGRGFLARLSGATSEFLSMWSVMMMGRQPFSIDPSSGELRFRLLPALPIWLFFNSTEDPSSDELIMRFKLFSSIDVTYHNTLRTDLFNIAPSRYDVRFTDGSTTTFDGEYIPSSAAIKIRRIVSVKSIDAYI